MQVAAVPRACTCAVLSAFAANAWPLSGARVHGAPGVLSDEPHGRKGNAREARESAGMGPFLQPQRGRVRLAPFERQALRSFCGLPSGRRSAQGTRAVRRELPTPREATRIAPSSALSAGDRGIAVNPPARASSPYRVSR